MIPNTEYLVIAKDNQGRPQNYYTDSLKDAEELYFGLKADRRIEYAELCAGTPGHWSSKRLYERSPRLTKWNGKKWVLPQGKWREIAERLAAYEDMGTPDEIREMLKYRGWLDDPVGF